jgi:hypothetical protein
MDLDGSRRLLRGVLLGSLALAVALLLWSAGTRTLGYFRGQLILTFLGLSVGCVLALIDTWVLPHHPRSAQAALGILITSQISYYVLVWTDLKKVELIWRVWWLFAVASIASAHLLALRFPTTLPRGKLDRAAFAGALGSAAMLALLSFWSTFPAEPPLWYWAVLAVPAAASVGGSFALWLRRRPRKDDRPVPMARWAKTAWILASQAAVFLAGYYVGGGTRTDTPFEIMPSALVGLPPDKLDQQLRADLERLRSVSSGLDDMAGKAETLYRELEERRRAESREFYRPEEDDRIRWHFVTYLSYRASLLRIGATYGNYESVREPEARARCFMVGYAAVGMAYEAALQLTAAYGPRPVVRKKLNEPEPRWGLPANMYDRIVASTASETNERMYHEMGAYYVARRDEWRRDRVWGDADFQWMDERIGRSLDYVQSHPVSRSRQWLSQLAKRVRSDVYTPVYAVQSVLSEMIGDLRIVKDAPLISVRQIKEEVEPLLKPGDIFLERRNWFLSNAFLPGFWPHGALYVGTPEDLRRLGIADHPEVKSRWSEYVRPAPDGEPHTVIESVSEGVIFNSVTESMHADYVAVLRPRLPEAQVAQAIARAFGHQGKPYDYEFDFFTSDKLVCTELVYRAYEGMLHFDLVRVMGRDTLPALEIGKKFAVERTRETRELDFVLFLDGEPSTGRARLAPPETFIESLGRERAFNE